MHGVAKGPAKRAAQLDEHEEVLRELGFSAPKSTVRHQWRHSEGHGTSGVAARQIFTGFPTARNERKTMRAAHAGAVRRMASVRMPTMWGTFDVIGLSDECGPAPRGRTALAIVNGRSVEGIPLLRIDSQCVTGDCWGRCAVIVGTNWNGHAGHQEEVAGSSSMSNRRAAARLDGKLEAYESEDAGLDRSRLIMPGVEGRLSRFQPVSRDRARTWHQTDSSALEQFAQSERMRETASRWWRCSAARPRRIRTPSLI